MFSRDLLLSDSVVTQQLEECLYGVKFQLQWRLRELQLTATQHRFLMQGVKKKKKKRGRGEMNVRNLKFPKSCLQILIRGKVRMGVAYCTCSFNFSCYFPSFHFQFFTCSLKIALVFCQRQNLKMSPIKRFTGTKKYVS